MNLTYEFLCETLAKKYRVAQKNGGYYFVNDKSQVVAIVDYNKISMYFYVPKDIIWSHKDRVVATFVKDLNVNGELCDVISVLGLCGSSNDINVIGNFGLTDDCNLEVFCSPDDYKNQMAFQKFMSEIKSANESGLSSAIFCEVKEDIGSCGSLTLENGKVNLKIGDNIFINNLICTSSAVASLDINIIDIKEKVPTDYEDIYKYYRKYNDWYFSDGYNTTGSKEIRDFTERRKYSTFDKDKIHYDAETIIFSNKIVR